MAMDTYYVEYYNRSNNKIGIRVSAYSSYDAQRFVEGMPDYYMLATFPQRVESGNN